MNAAHCNGPALAYNHRRGVRNLIGGPRTRQTCGFFVPPRPDSIYGLEGQGISNTCRRSYAVLNLQAALFWGIASTSENDRSASHGQ